MMKRDLSSVSTDGLTDIQSPVHIPGAPPSPLSRPVRGALVRRATMLVLGSAIAGALPFAVGAQGEVCIDQETVSRVNACPTGAPPAGQRAGSEEATPASHLQRTKRTDTAQPAQQQQAPSYTVERDPTEHPREARALELLRQEIATAERIVGRMRSGDPQGAVYLLRLADTYFELQTYWNTRLRSQDEPIFQAQQAGNEQEVQRLTAIQTEAEQQLGQARESAIRTYARVVQDYPNYPQMDQVLFRLAFALEEMHQVDRARQVYYRLIKGFPESRFIPYAYLSFAEFYFAEGEMDSARQFYTKVTEFPPERNPVYGYALYKQAWVLYNLEDYRGALTQFARTIEFANSNADAHDASNLARQARRELVLPYSRVGRPNQALEFFRRYATNEEQAFEMLEALAELYFDTGQWNNTIAVYHQLMAEQPNSHRLCHWQTKVSNAVISSRPKPEIVAELRRLIDLYNLYRQAEHPAADLASCRSDTATILVELAIHWHQEAVGNPDDPDPNRRQSGTNDRDTMAQTARLYRLILDTFPDLDQMEFPNISREDWPTAYRVQYFYAELLWATEDWAHCGTAFDRVVELNPQGEYTSDAALAAVHCYNRLYQTEYERDQGEVRRIAEPEEEEGGRRGGRRRRRRRQEQQEQQAQADTFQPREYTDVERGMIAAFTRYICFVDDAEELPVVKYRRARIYYETNHFAEAALAFRDIAFNHRDHQLALFAANLYLDSLNALGTRVGTGNPACISEIENNLEPLHSTFCSTQEMFNANAELCEVVRDLRCQVVRLRAEGLSRNGRHREAANAYREIVQRYRECGRLDEVIYNLAIEYEAARLLGRAIRARQTLIERIPDSPLAKRSIYLVGANFHALAIYDQAATWYERFAREYPGEDGSDCTDVDRQANTCAIAHVALSNALYFRLGLGDEEHAVADVELYEDNYRRTRARETASARFALGSLYERRQDWGAVFRHYHNWVREYGRQGLPHEVMQAHVMLGRSLWESDEVPQAESHFRAAVNAWERGGQQAIERAQGVSDEERELWMARARRSASEALFYLAEYKFQEFRAIRFPRVPSTRTLASVNRWSQSELVPWLQQKRQALQAAEAAYNRIAPLQVPQWQIAAAARIGEMYQTIVNQMRSAPIPEEIENDDELYDIYVDALEGALNGSGPGPDGRPFTPDDVACTMQSEEPQCVNSPVRQAMSKFEFCLRLATQVRWFNEFSASCERELNQLDPQRYPMASELRGTASFVQNQSAEPIPIELSLEGEGEEPAAEAASGDSAVTQPSTSSSEGQQQTQQRAEGGQS